MRKSDNIDKAVLFGVLPLLLLVIANPLRSDTEFEGAYSNPYYPHIRLLFLFLICGYLCMKHQRLIRPVSTTRVILLWMVWVVMTSISWETDDTLGTYIKSTMPSVLLWPLVYLFFYVLAKRQSPTISRVLIAYFCVLFFYCSDGFMEAYHLANAGVSIDSNFASLNEIYYPLLLLPWILSLKKKTLHYLGFAALSILVFYSMKRTALIGLVTAAVAYFIFDNMLRTSFWSKLIAALGMIALVVGASMLFSNIDTQSNSLFSKRLGTEEFSRGGGRPEVFKQTLGMILDSTTGKAIVGHGQNAVSKDAPEKFSAHNDWLEVQYDFGVVGLLLYALLHCTLIVKARKLLLVNSFYAPAFAVSYMLFFCMSLTSHLVIYPTYFIFLAAFWGMVIGLTEPQSGLRTDLTVANQALGRI